MPGGRVGGARGEGRRCQGRVEGRREWGYFSVQ